MREGALGGAPPRSGSAGGAREACGVIQHPARGLRPPAQGLPRQPAGEPGAEQPQPLAHDRGARARCPPAAAAAAAWVRGAAL